MKKKISKQCIESQFYLLIKFNKSNKWTENKKFKFYVKTIRQCLHKADHHVLISFDAFIAVGAKILLWRHFYDSPNLMDYNHQNNRS